VSKDAPPLRVKALPASPTADRRAILEHYLVACVRDSKLSWADLHNARIDKLLRVLTDDVKIVLGDLGRRGGETLVQMGVGFLMDFAANALKKK
jgi:hypothetical protein